MAAGWPDDNLLAGGLGAAGWLAGKPQRPQNLRQHSRWVKLHSRGADDNQLASRQDRNKEAYKLQGCRASGLQGLPGYKATRL